jgi:hypothetical protein
VWPAPKDLFGIACMCEGMGVRGFVERSVGVHACDKQQALEPGTIRNKQGMRKSCRESTGRTGLPADGESAFRPKYLRNVVAIVQQRVSGRRPYCLTPDGNFL